MFKKVEKFLVIITETSSRIGELWILLILITIIIDILGRTFFNSPLIGTTELVQNSLPAIIFLIAPYCTYKGLHVRATIIVNRLSKKGMQVFEILTDLAGIALFMGLIYSLWEPMIFSTSIREFQGEGLRVPVYPVYWCIMYGSVLCLCQCIWRVIHTIQGMAGKEVIDNLNDEGVAI